MNFFGPTKTREWVLEMITAQADEEALAPPARCATSTRVGLLPKDPLAIVHLFGVADAETDGGVELIRKGAKAPRKPQLAGRFYTRAVSWSPTAKRGP